MINQKRIIEKRNGLTLLIEEIETNQIVNKEMLNFAEFNQELAGFRYFCKKTNKEVQRYILFYKNLSTKEIFNNYNTKNYDKKN